MARKNRNTCRKLTEAAQLNELRNVRPYVETDAPIEEINETITRLRGQLEQLRALRGEYEGKGIAEDLLGGDINDVTNEVARHVNLRELRKLEEATAASMSASMSAC